MSRSSLDEFIADLVDQIAEAVAGRISCEPTQEPTGELVDEPTMAKRLGISQPTLQRQRAAGKVPFVRLGRRVLYSPAAVEAALNSDVRGRQP